MKIKLTYEIISFYCVAFCFMRILFLQKNPGDPAPPTPPQDSIPVTPPVDPDPVDPATASTIGFFLDDLQPKIFTIPSFTDAAMPSSTTVTVMIRRDKQSGYFCWL